MKRCGNAAYLKKFKAPVSSHLIANSVNVVLYRLLREIEMSRDLFVGKPACDKRNKLTLAARERKWQLAGCHPVGRRMLCDKVEQNS